MRTSFCGRLRDRAEAFWQKHKNWEAPPIPKNVRRVVGAVQTLLPFLADREDTLIQKTLKGISLAEAVYRIVEGNRLISEYSAYLEQWDLVQSSNRNLAQLLSQSKILEMLPCNEIPLSHGEAKFWEINSEQGKFLLGIGEYNSSLAYPENFDVPGLLNSLWSWYGNCITISVPKRGHGNLSLESFQEHHGEILGSAKATYEHFLSQHRRFKANGKSRTYLFYGPPGTGKSTFSRRLALETSSRVLIIDATSISFWGCDELLYLLSALQPEFVLLDDIDRASSSMFLPLLERVKQEVPETSFVITVNDVSKLDKALFRPGRIDTVHEFLSPVEDDRREVILGYLKQSLQIVDKETLEFLVKSTEGMSQDYLRELVLRLDYEDVPSALLSVMNLWNLSGGKSSNSAPVPVGSSSEPEESESEPKSDRQPPVNMTKSTVSWRSVKDGSVSSYPIAR
jgi:hypothetical protein